ncbi:hypothetical protein FEM48_Zijuj04G0109700 [Ziziphus jujuba var. spinosa]|uniref:Diacylglycerol O-acyltransferase n=1 Tax=Ziziphus jujuba var. spinosa TaxID=714518 RepID=A0A978VJH5_ZIZJJ|nr:hypothetical protein FEM48_Zijuj04G0109700 [Ziziphus jujuba var. spinosa]
MKLINIQKNMEFGETGEPVSPNAQYFNSSILSISILAVLEFEIPINFTDAQIISLINHVFLPINERFSSIMVEDQNGKKRWKRVEVLLEDHVKTPIFPSSLSPESYDDHFDDYLSKISQERFSQNKPLWEIHIVKYPTTKAAGNVIFKLHHALGDGYSLMGALLSCLQRAENPSLPLTFPSRRSSRSMINREKRSVFSYIPHFFSSIFETVSDFSWSILKSSLIEDHQTAIRSGNEGLEFQPTIITTIAFSLDQIKLIKDKLGVTINDVIVGIIFLGSQLYMQEISISQEANNISSGSESHSTALVLLNTRMLGDYKSIKEMTKHKADMPWGNRFTFLHIPIPSLTKLSNPLDFVYYSQKLVARKRNSFDVYLTSMLLDIMKKLGGADAVSGYIRKTLKNTSMTISNMIGPVEQMALANHPIKGLYHMVIGTPQDLDISVISYMGELRVAFGTEKGHIDPHKFKLCMQNAYEIILEATLNKSTKNKLN